MSTHRNGEPEIVRAFQYEPPPPEPEPESLAPNGVPEKKEKKSQRERPDARASANPVRAAKRVQIVNATHSQRKLLRKLPDALIPHQFKPGPDPRRNRQAPHIDRPPSHALAQLNDARGDTPEEMIENFKDARREAGGLQGADHIAIAMFLAQSNPDVRTHVQAFDSATDRLEGKIPQPTTVTFELNNRAAALALEFGKSPEEVLALCEVEVLSSTPTPQKTLPPASQDEGEEK